MGVLSELLRLVKITGLKDGQIQAGRIEAHSAKSHEQAARWQDYGFAAHPVEGQGLAIGVAGHTIILRMDRLAEQPALQDFEVAIWHKEGHLVRLSAGKKISIENATEVIVNASASIQLNTPTVVIPGQLEVTGDAIIGGKSFLQHTHGGVEPGGAQTSAPV